MSNKAKKKGAAGDVHVRIPRDVADVVEALAKKADRNLTKQITFMLKNHPLVSPEKTTT